MDNNDEARNTSLPPVSSSPPPPTQEQALPPYQAQTTTEVLSSSDANASHKPNTIYDDRSGSANTPDPAATASVSGLDLREATNEGATAVGGSSGDGGEETEGAGTSVQVALQSFIVANPVQDDGDNGNDENSHVNEQDLAAAAAAAASTPLQTHLQSLVAGGTLTPYHAGVGAGVVDDSPPLVDHSHQEYNELKSDNELREQDRFLPIANVARIMKKTIPPSGKVSKGAKECVQECVSEFISFITSEASERCQQEKRKTINGEDILFAMQSLGFDNYIDPLKLFLQKYRDSNKGERIPGSGAQMERVLPEHEISGSPGADQAGASTAGQNQHYLSLIQPDSSNHPSAGQPLFMSQYSQQMY